MSMYMCACDVSVCDVCVIYMCECLFVRVVCMYVCVVFSWYVHGGVGVVWVWCGCGVGVVWL